MRKVYGILLLSLFLLTACVPKEKTIELNFNPNNVRYIEIQNNVLDYSQASFDLSEDGSEDVIEWLAGLPGRYEYSKKLNYSKTSGGSLEICKLFDENRTLIAEFQVESGNLVLVDADKQIHYLYYKDGADLEKVYEWLGIIYH